MKIMDFILVLMDVEGLFQIHLKVVLNCLLYFLIILNKNKYSLNLENSRNKKYINIELII